MAQTGMPDYIGAKVKSFWERPEGTTGMVILALALGAAFWMWALILPFILTVLTNTIYAVAMAGALTFLWYNKNLISSVFQGVSRGLTRLWATIDPIGNLENDLVQDKKDLAAMENDIEKLSGQIEGFDNEIRDTKENFEEAMSTASQARNQLSKSKNEAEREALQRQLVLSSNEGGRQKEYLTMIEGLRTTAVKIYEIMNKWRDQLDSLIKDKENYIKMEKRKLKMAKVGNSIVERARNILRPDPERVYLQNAAIEAAREKYSQQMGAIKNFARTSNDLLVKGDLKNEMYVQQALRQIEEFDRQQKAVVGDLKNQNEPVIHELAREVPQVSGASSEELRKYFQ